MVSTNAAYTHGHSAGDIPITSSESENNTRAPTRTVQYMFQSEGDNDYMPTDDNLKHNFAVTFEEATQWVKRAMQMMSACEYVT